MAFLLVKKFKLRCNGVDNPAGSVVELADEVANRLAVEAPKEFELLDKLPDEAQITIGKDSNNDKTEKAALEKLPNKELITKCEELGIEVPAKPTKAVLLGILAKAVNGVEEVSGLPSLNPAVTIKA